MKTIKRILSVILTLALMMSLICVPGYAEDTKTIDLAIEFSALGNRSEFISSVEAGTEFTMWVTFNGNPTELADSIQAYDLLIGYDSAKIAVSGAAKGLTSPTFNKAFADGVMYAGWSDVNGIVSGKDIAKSGVLFQINARATEALVAADLRAVTFIETATHAYGREQSTQLVDGNGNKFNYTQVSKVKEIATINLAVQFSGLNDMTKPLKNIAAGTDFTMWVAFDGNPATLADSIQAYDLLIGYDTSKIAISGAAKGLTSPTFNKAFADGVMYAGWSDVNGIVSGKDIAKSGVLFQINARATSALTAEDLSEIVFIEEATNAYGRKQTTQLFNGNREELRYNQVSEIIEMISKTIDLAIQFTAYNNITKPVGSIVSGTDFTMWVAFDGNPAKLADSIQAYDLLIGYDSAKISVSGVEKGLTSPTFNKAFADGVMYAGWSDVNGIVSGKDLQTTGVLFQINAKATDNLTAADLSEIVFIEEATNAYGRKQSTQLVDSGKNLFNYNQVSKIIEIESKTIDLSIVFSEYDDMESTVSSISEGELFTMWVTFAGNPTEKAESIQAYDLLISYNPDKILFSSEEDELGVYGTYDVFNHAFADGIMYAGWASTNGILDGKNIAESGVLFQIDAKAAADITSADLLAMEFIAEATNDEGKKQSTRLVDGNKIPFDYDQIPTVEPGEEPDEPDEPEKTTITEADFEIDTADKEYTGSAIEPTVTPLTGLTVDVDYTVEYSNNTSVGTATITVTGIGDYTGTVTKTFNIVAAEEPEEPGDEPDEPTGPTIDLGIVFTEYDERENPITSVAAGTKFSMWVTFAGNPTEKAKSIQAYDLVISYDSTKMTFLDEDSDGSVDVYGGLAIPVFNPEFTTNVAYAGWASTNGIVGKKNIAESGDLFYVEVRANEDLTADDLRAIVFLPEATDGVANQSTRLSDGNKDRFGYRQIDTIVETVEITEADFSFDLADKEYTGEAITPAVTPLTGLTVGVDYTVEYSNNVEAGTATITVTGTGNYTGTIVKTFTIKAKPDAPTYKMGDVNGDGDVKSGDALIVLKIVANLPDAAITPESRARADVNGDGDTKSGDALIILKIVANLPL